MRSKQVLDYAVKLADARWGTRFITANTRDTRAIASIVIESCANVIRSASKRTARRESFDEAVTRLALTEADLVKRESEFGWLARAYGIMMVVTFALTLVAESLLGICAGILATTLAGINWLNWSLRLWQVRHRTLCDMRQFLQQPAWFAEWLK